jgi:hypothetical protein
MVMEEEVKELLKDIKKLEERRDKALDNKDLTSSDSLRVSYQKEADDLEKTIIRRMEVLRIISRD